MKSALKRLVNQTAIYGLSSIVGKLINFLLVPYYTRVFLKHEYGVVIELYAYITFLLVILTYGMETGFFRFAEGKKDIKNIYSSILIPLFITSSSFIIIGYLFSQSIADILNYSENVNYIKWFIIIVGIDSFVAVPFAKLRQQNKALKFALVKLTSIILNIVLIIFFLEIVPKSEFLTTNIFTNDLGVGYIFLANMITSLTVLVIMLPEIVDINFKVDFKLFKQILIYSIPLMFAGLAGMINETVDKVLLRQLLVIPENCLNPDDYILSQIGIYGANFKIAIFMTLFIQTFRYAAEPFFFSQINKENSKKMYSVVMKYFVFLSLLIFLGIILFIDIVKYFIDESYHEGLKIVPILLTAKLFFGIVFNLSIWYKITHQTKFAIYITLSGAIVTLTLNFILVPIYGYIGAAWATFFCYFVMMILSYLLSKTYYPIKYDLKNIMKYVILAILIFTLNSFLNIDNILFFYTIKTTLIIAFMLYFIYNEGLFTYIKQFIIKRL